MLSDYFPNEKTTPVDDLIETILEEMRAYGPNEPEYTPLMEKLERLYALKAEDKPKRASRDTIIQAGAYLVGILTLGIIERGHILPPNAAKQISRTMR